MNFVNLTLGQYIPTGSFIHRLDPRAKLFSLLLIISAVFPAESVFELGIWTGLLIALVYASKISWFAILRSARPIMFLVIFTFVFNIIATSFSDSFINAFTHALFTSSRLFILMLYAVMLPLTTAPLELADGLDAMFSPLERFHFPAHESSMMIAMALRFIP
ncbi:MAG: energy-coupling factor transporter transmembrane protein EcfT, partial [Synergistaceae bacterium]|nr:energy-coupling factor transporter transmembrane protein EcfT [Synergistaceae bacterium]